MKLPIKALAFLLLIVHCCMNNRTVHTVRSNDSSNSDIVFSLISFQLDSSTVNTTNQVQYLSSVDGNDFLTFINPFEETIVFYNYSSKALSGKLSYSSAAKGEKIQGYTISDRYLYLYSYKNSILTKVDLDNWDVIYRQAVYHRSPADYNPVPYISTSSPIMKYDDKVILPGFIAGEAKKKIMNRPVLSILDEKSLSERCRVNYPHTYNKGNWGGGFCFRRPYTTLSKEGKVIISFAASDSLVVYDPTNESLSCFMARSQMIKNISPYSTLSRGIFVSADDEYNWYLRTASYENIIFDPWNNVYYRLFRLPVKSLPPQGTLNPKPLGVIVLDSTFSYKKEYLLPEMKYLTDNAFVSRDGLNIQIKTDNEDEMVFALFGHSIFK